METRGGEQWERVRETRKTKILITGLKSDTQYQFRVTATNDLIKSVATTEGSCTNESKAKIGVTCGCDRAIFFLLAPVSMLLAIKTDRDIDAETFAAITTFTLPISLICAPVTVPVGAVWAARDNIKMNCYIGDLSP